MDNVSIQFKHSQKTPGHGWFTFMKFTENLVKLQHRATRYCNDLRRLRRQDVVELLFYFTVQHTTYFTVIAGPETHATVSTALQPNSLERQTCTQTGPRPLCSTNHQPTPE